MVYKNLQKNVCIDLTEFFFLLSYRVVNKPNSSTLDQTRNQFIKLTSRASSLSNFVRAKSIDS